MKRHQKWLLWGGGSILMLLTAVLAALLFLTGDWFLLHVALPRVGRKLELELAADKVTYSWRKNRLTVTQLRGGSESDPCFLMGEVAMTPDFKEILKGRLGCRDFHLDRPELALYHQPNGDWTLYPSGKHIYFEDVPEIRIKGLSYERGRFTVVSGRPGAGKVMDFTNYHGGAPYFSNLEPLKLSFDGHLELGTAQTGTVRSGDCSFTLQLQLDEEFSLRQLAAQLNVEELYGRFGDDAITHLGIRSDLALSFPAQGGTVVEHCRVESRDRQQLRSLLDFSGRSFPDSEGFSCMVREGHMMPEMTSLFCETLLDLDPGACILDFKGAVGWRKNQFMMLRGDLSVDRRGAIAFRNRKFTPPAHHLKISTDLRLDWQKGFATIRHGSLLLKADNREVASAQLVKPVQCALDAEDGRFSCAAFQYWIRGLDLRDLICWLPEDRSYAAQGKLGLQGEIRIGNPVSGLQVSGEGGVKDFEFVIPPGRLPVNRVDCHFLCRISRSGEFLLPEMRADLFRDRELCGTLTYGEKSNAVPGESSFSLNIRSESLRRLMPATSGVSHLLEFAGQCRTQIRSAGRRRGVLFSVMTYNADLSNESGDQVTLDVDPFRIRVLDMNPESDIYFRGSGHLSSKLVRQYISHSQIYPEGGRLLWRADGSIARNWRNIRCRGRAELRKTKLHLWHLTLPECTAEPRFEILFRDLNVLEISHFLLRLRQADGKTLMCFHGDPCVWQFSPEKFSGSGVLRELNAEILNAAFPGVFERAGVTGRVEGSLTDGTLNGTLELSLKDGLTRRNQRPLAGELGFSVRQKEGELQIQDFRFQLSDGRSAPWLTLLGAFQRGPKTFQLDLVSPSLDLGEWLAVLPDNAASSPQMPPNGQSAASPPPALPNERSGKISIRCQKLKLGPTITGSFSARLLQAPGKIQSEHILLELNQAKMTGTLSAQNEAGGIRVRQHFQLQDPVSLPPFAAYFTGRPGSISTGLLTVLSGEIELLDSGLWQKAVQTLSGHLDSEVQQLTIQPGLDHTPGVRILLSPVDIFSHVASLLPERFGQWRQKMIDSARFSDFMTTVRFTRGVLGFEAKDGRVTVKSCDFSGEDQLVRHLQLSGQGGITADAPLDLRAYVSGNAGQLTIPITGTMSDPKVNFNDVATASAGDFMQKVKDLNLIGEVSVSPEKRDPLVVVDHLPAAGFWKSAGRFFRNCFGGTDVKQGIR